MIASNISRVAAVSSGVVAAAWGWWQMDAAPSLYLRDKFRSKTHRSEGDAKRLWIVGASSGIGEQFAYQWVEEQPPGSHLILSSRSAERLHQVASKCRQRNSECEIHVHPFDVTGDDDILAEAVATLPVKELDTVWLNAGQGQLACHSETSSSMVHQIVAANAIWPVILTPLLLKHEIFSSSRHPHIMVTTSVAAKVGVPLSAVYAASKHFLHGYFRSLIAERHNSLSIELLCLGPVNTDFHKSHADTSGKVEGKKVGTEVNIGADSTNNRLKMSSARCAKLLMTAYSRQGTSGIREVWVSNQPALTVLYLQRVFPSLAQWMINRVGSKRVKLWQQGLDLYDPDSWKK